MVKKMCCKCNELKDEEEFPHERLRGRYPYCKPCKAKYMRDRRKIKGNNVREVERRLYLFKTYNITQNDYDNILKNQKGGCAICGEPKSTKGKTHIYLAVDHSHKTNKIRGLLCNSCNRGIGYFRDRIELLERAVLYLKGGLKW